jgi:chromatin assembly factor 1 subunit B
VKSSSISEECVSVEFLSNLKRHTRSVNVVRFAPNGTFENPIHFLLTKFMSESVEFVCLFVCSGELLASGGDDGFIFLWKLDVDGQHREIQRFGDEDDDSVLNKENWNIVSTIRYVLFHTKSSDSSHFKRDNLLKKFELFCNFCSGSTSEIYDLAWSPDSQFLIFGSIDNTACVWDVIRGNNYLNNTFRYFHEKLFCYC